MATHQLEIGDPMPALALGTLAGGEIDLRSDTLAGHPIGLVLIASGGHPPAGVEGLARSLKDADGHGFAIAERGSNLAGLADLADPEGRLRAAYGAAEESRILIVAPNGHVAGVFVGSGAAREAADLVDRLAAARRTIVPPPHPPVLILPDVLSAADCQRLMAIFALQGQRFVEPGHSKAEEAALRESKADYKMRIPEYGRKDRIDHWIQNPETNALIDDRLRRRLFPEIEKCFQYRITRRETYRIGRYEGERGGESHGHRDNTKPNVAHRRFACSINLNTPDFAGGEIRFPEFGDQRYRPETGAAIVFSCSLLHEPLQVTAGERFVLLAFLFGDR